MRKEEKVRYEYVTGRLDAISVLKEGFEEYGKNQREIMTDHSTQFVVSKKDM